MWSALFSPSKDDPDSFEDNAVSLGSPDSIVNSPEANAAMFSTEFSNQSDPCLEGNLMMRKGRATGNGSIRWKKRYVHLSFADGGSMSVYEETPESIKFQQVQAQSQLQTYSQRRQTRGTPAQSLYSKFHRRVSAILHDPMAIEDSSHLLVYVPNHLSWVAKDVENTRATFVIEIPTNNDGDMDGVHIGKDVGDDVSITNGGQGEEVNSNSPSRGYRVAQDDDLESVAEEVLNSEISAARKRGKPVRIYFKCRKGQGEKALWLEAFSRIGRLSLNDRHTHGIISAVVNGVQIRPNHRSRQRNTIDAQFAKDARRIVGDLDDVSLASDTSGATVIINQVCFGKPSKKNADKEYRVQPGYCYPHRWMKFSELYDEMTRESAHFVDLRNPEQSQNEIGNLKVEVLQCVGLPKLDRFEDTDAVVYLVAGPCAFATDIIPDRNNPMWLRNARRACIFPIYHGYARLFVGVFDDDGEKSKDDLAGRVVIDLARLRPNSQYDVTIPLRMSTSVYSRRKRGAIRMRFTLSWNEKDALLSYIPKKIKFKTPKTAKPNLSTTIACADAKAFRNVATTVHGMHMPGRFTFPKIKSAIKEINYTRKYIIGGLRQEIKDLSRWVNPALSGYIFCTWMHCIVINSFGLVPAYVVVFILLQLIRTYALYAVEGPMTEGFLPPTWEELLQVLLKPSSARSIEPLHLHRQSDLSNSYHSDFRAVDTMHIQTHEAKGRWLFQLLNFIPRRGSICDRRNLHLEFPFADGNVYEKFTVKDCLADRDDAENEEMKNNEFLEEEGSQFDSMSSFPMDSTNESSRHKTRVMSRIAPMRMTRRFPGKLDDDSVVSEVDENEDEQMNSEDEQMNSEDEMEPKNDNMVVLQEAANYLNPVNAVNVIRDQDIDYKSDKKEKITDLLDRVGYRMHSIMFHAFNDYVYTRKNKDSLYFNDAKNIEKRRNQKKRHRVEKKLDKLLDTKQYSHPNPLIARLGLYVEPIIDAVFGYLCIFRAGFNVATWQDPYLTFLLSVILCVLALVLFIIPWRPTLFAVGMFLVGPQNWVIRKLRERGTLPPIKPKEKKEEPPEEEDHVVFHSTKRLEGILMPKQPQDPNPLEVQHIVVPYGHLMYQRMYDWPPEQQYATVVPVRDETLSLEHGLSELSIGSSASHKNKTPKKNKNKGTRYPRLHKLRRRVAGGKKQDLSQLLELSSEFNSDEEVDPLSPVSKND